MTTRRQLVLTLGASVLALPLAAKAEQTAKTYRIGILAVGHPGDSRSLPALIIPALRELGYAEGKNLHIDSRYAEGDIERLPELAAELVRLNVDVIIAATNLAAFPAKRATSAIPIVVVASHGAAETGLIASYGRPGGNVTGSESLAPELDVKRLDLLRETLPKATKIAVMSNPLDQGTALHQKWSRTAAEALKLKLEMVSVAHRTELEVAFAAISQMHADALLIFTDVILFSERQRIAEYTLKNRLPMFTEFKEYAELGGLMSYGAKLTGLARSGARYVDKILRGAKPADLPVERAAEFELVLNQKTARALGIKVPQSLLVRADRVIE